MPTASADLSAYPILGLGAGAWAETSSRKSGQEFLPGRGRLGAKSGGREGMAGRDQHGWSSEAQRLRQARATLEHGGEIEVGQDTWGSVELIPRTRDRGRARHTGVSGINSQDGDSQGQSLDQKMLSPVGPHSPEVMAQEDGQGTTLVLTYPLVCPSAVHRCCHAHDCCYTHAESSGCSPKLQPYSWNCVNQTVKCEPTEDKCQELICKCDQEFAYCLARTEYNIKYLFYPNFLCGNYSPECD
uniref:Phospholipase A2 n=1 Tax=Capra hircus TaxID=9925 RepID=A0A8C2XZQ8_CAPHI